jgi:hypothetical protein
MVVSNKLHTLAALYERRNPTVPTEQEAGQAQCQSESLEEINIQALPGTKAHFFGPPGCNLVSTPISTALSWLTKGDNYI